jgi:heptosyltransferase-1
MPRILIIKTSSLGDVVHNLPVVADILQHQPGTQIDWVVEEGFSDIPVLHPGVCRVLPVAMRRWRRTLWSPGTWGEIATFRRHVREQEYDAVIDTQGLLKSAILASMARGPTHGQDRAAARESLAARFYANSYPVARGRHAVIRNRELVAKALGIEPPSGPPDYGIEESARPLSPPREANAKFTDRPYAVFLHGTSRAGKEWPEHHWRELAGRLKASGLQVLLPWGNANEQARAGRIGSGGLAVVLPRLGLRDLAAIMVRASVVIGVDSGLTHLACALDRPTAAIYTDTSPVLTGVYPRDASRAVNLGGPGRCPPVDDVWAALQPWLPVS